MKGLGRALGAALIGLAMTGAANSGRAAILFVAPNGNNASAACAEAAPCATLTNAFDKSAAGDTIVCMGPADYGPGLSINRSIAIDCEGGRVTTNFYIFTFTEPNIVVRFKGMTVAGGVVFSASGTLILKNMTLIGSASSGEAALQFELQGGAAKLLVSDSTIVDSPAGNVLISGSGPPYTPTGPAQALFERVTFAKGPFGIKADGARLPGVIDVEVRDSSSSQHTNNGFIAVSPSGGGQVRFKITRSTAAGNGSFGAVASGPRAFMIVGGSSLTGNGTGLAQLDGATVASYGNNEINFNTANTAGTITAIPLR